MKKLIALCLAILMVVALLPATLISVSAQTGSVDFSVGDISGMPGDLVEVEIAVSGTASISGLLLYNIQYNTSALEFIGFDNFGTLVTSSSAGAASVQGSTINLGYSPNIVPNGTICTAVFRIKDAAPEGDFAIGFAYVTASDNGTAVSNTFTAGNVNVFHWVRGDFNQDGTVNMLDAVYFIGWVNFSYTGLYPMVYNGDKDFNKDGVIDMKDAVYFIGWVNFPYSGLYPIDWDGEVPLPVDPDTDGDGLTDADEINIYWTDPADPDTDGDGANDGWEVANGFDPCKYNSSFTNVIGKPKTNNDPEVAPSVKMSGSLPGAQAQTLKVEESKNEKYLQEFDGTIGKAYDFSMAGSFNEATISFEFDETLNDPEDPVIVYVYEKEENGATHVKELETEVNGNVASATVNHFSTYMLIDRAIFTEKNSFRDVWGEGNNGSSSYTRAEVILVIDNSDSMKSNDSGNVRLQAANQIVSELSQSDKILFGVVKFSDVINVLTPTLVSNDDDTISNFLTTSYFTPNGLTNMYTAIQRALPLFSTDDDVLRVVVVLTDGLTFDGEKHDETLSMANAKDARIFTIGFGTSSNLTQYYNDYLIPLAEGTDGIYKHAEIANDLLDIYKELGEKIDLKTDTDGDGIVDYYEKHLTDVKFVNAFQFKGQLDPNNRDSDGDNYGDGIEIKMTYYENIQGVVKMVTGYVMSDPTNPASTPKKP